MRFMLTTALGLALAAPLATPAIAQETEGYQQPPQEITDIVLRAPSPAVSVSPDGETLLLLERESLPPVADLARPMEKLAGLRLDSSINDRHGTRAYVGMTLRNLDGSVEMPVSLPANADISDMAWSPDGSRIAFTNTYEDGMALMVLDAATGEATTVLERGINPIFQGPRWLPDGRLLALTIPENRGPMPTESLTPAGPAIQDASGGEEAQTRTYQDLLENPHDEALFTWLGTSQPIAFDLNSGERQVLGEARLYTYAAASPDGEYMLQEWLEQPFSYQVPYSSFPLTSVVTDADGEMLATIAQQPLADNLPVQGVPTGRRSIIWHPTEPALLVWAEALDGGDPRVETDERDAMYGLAAPFTGNPREIARFEDRFSGFMGMEGTDDVIAYDYDRDTRELRLSQIDVTGDNAPREVFMRNIQDAYADPGSPVMVTTDAGFGVARNDDGVLLLSGSGATPDGLRPFLRRFDLATLETEEVWRASGENLESVVDVLEDDGSSFITFYENPLDPGNFRLHDDGDVTALTTFPDPHPELTGISRELVTYTRADGTELTATLYLPADYEEGQTLPLVVWAYPREFNNAATASQNRDSPYRFTRIGGYSQLFFLTQGYAVLDNAAMPVIGDDPETVNDTFIEQIVSSAQAAVDFAVERGISDGYRVGVGGHSYGAFMTAHLLARSDIFRAGIARSGAYNRTLTPFGFQSERRIFWDTPETYYELSPFMAADMINEPMLLIHGDNDNNSGTFPQQSERMFAAIRGTGGTARLVMLPHESHGYRGRESVLHTLAEMIDWFDEHVKNAEAPAEGD
ncbi:prolyl oligopeptidase family serine peptidase [Aurantiacibacter gangjinensis]|uniref:Peptidase S9 prolyl oligopeptidase n=1 Tax=Aurantiacibacter gangjinensis TaxID=502682 RepID=A0A0G9MUN6_9SPHN|nr:prolyl oligopeptidase family serine peptidase [Aurantiacibacter gangjinensis]APE28907.1 Dipeptidyl aminopeptidase/acylaminoacyl-peptidase [Aurantiacibacter gangjinensis]KLE33033.1 peptidase S9 prolyl oligopeptidase [Aurantiacibacter gangjinensis]